MQRKEIGKSDFNTVACHTILILYDLEYCKYAGDVPLFMSKQTLQAHDWVDVDLY